MLGVNDDEMALAAKKLSVAGFVRQTWSFSSMVDPATRADDKMYERVHARIRPAYANFDSKTIRFQYPDEKKYTQCTVLIPASYIRLRATVPAYKIDHGESSQPPFYVERNLHYPNIVMLLQSVISVYLEDRERSKMGHWHARLEGWAIGYLYGELSLRPDILDTCGDERVKEYFNREINRGSDTPRIREKFGRPRALNTNDLIEEFQ